MLLLLLKQNSYNKKLFCTFFFSFHIVLTFLKKNKYKRNRHRYTIVYNRVVELPNENTGYINSLLLSIDGRKGTQYSYEGNLIERVSKVIMGFQM